MTLYNSKEEITLMKKTIYTIAGAALAVFSATAAGVAIGKKKKESSAAPIVLSGALGVAAGAAIAMIPRVQELRQRMVFDDLLDDGDVTLMEENISEVLGKDIEE